MKKMFLALVLLASNSLAGSSEHIELKKMQWQFDGIFGTVDRQAAQ